MTIEYGDKFIKRKTINGKIVVVFVVTEDPENDYLIKVSDHLPYKPGESHRFIHRSILERHWHNMNEGVQLKMFK